MNHVGQVERRVGAIERRSDNERRNQKRTSFMKMECRSEVPRRDLDRDERMEEGELWWSSSQQFF